MPDANVIFSGRPGSGAVLSSGMCVQGVQAPPPGSASTAGQDYQPPTQVITHTLASLRALHGDEDCMELSEIFVWLGSSIGLETGG